MNADKFTGKAEAYAKARPSYPEAAIDYITSLAPPDAVYADVGAGTGKFTELLAKRGYQLFAVEPNADMQKQLEITLSPYPNAKTVVGTAEATTLPNNSVDIITCAQALHWIDPNAFREECSRIGKSNSIVVALYNISRGGSSAEHCKSSTAEFFKNPTVKEFPNPIFFTRENWLAYMTSHSGDPLPSDPNYAEHVAEMNAIFDRESVDGLLKREVVTKICIEHVFNAHITKNKNHAT